MIGLVNAAILSIPLTAALWLALRVLPRRALSASARYLIWWTALLLIIALPLLYLPRQAPRSPSVSTATVHIIPAPHPLAHSAPIEIPRAPRTDWLLDAWVAISAIMLLRLLLSCATLLRLKRRAHPVGLTIPLPRGARILASSQISAPLAAGFLRPAILLPESLLEQLAPDQLEQVILHEAAHLTRFDDFALLLERALEAVFALHPSIRFIARQLDLEREIACDDRVVGSAHRAVSYAASLTRVAELCGRVSLPAAAFSSNLSRRIDMLLDRNSRTRFLIARVALALVTALAAITLLAKAPRLLALETPLPQLASAPLPIFAPPAAEPAPATKPAPRLVAQAKQSPQPAPAPVAPPRYVVEPVEVYTSDGSPVEDLMRGDFQVLEDGVQQTISAAVRDDSSSGAAYLIAYIPSPPNTDGHFARIRIMVDRPGLRVYARTGYYVSSGRGVCNENVRKALGLPEDSRCI